MADENVEENGKKIDLDKRKMIFIGAGAAVFIILLIFVFSGGSNTEYSTYILEKLDITTKPEIGKKTQVKIMVTLAFPKNDTTTEKEIILRREQIKNYIRETISQMYYYQLNTVDKRNKLKEKMLREINQNIMENPISVLYYSSNFVLQLN